MEDPKISDGGFADLGALIEAEWAAFNEEKPFEKPWEAFENEDFLKFLGDIADVDDSLENPGA